MKDLMSGEEDDIREVRKEEESRGRSRRPIDTEARKKAARLRKDLRKIIQSGDERAFIEILREAGLQEGTAEFAEAWKLFREVTKQR